MHSKPPRRKKGSADAEDLLREHRHLTFLVENSPLAVIEYDHEFRIRRWSAQAEKLFGWKAEEAMGKHNLELHLVHKSERSKVSAAIQRLMERHEPRNVVRNRNRRKNGSIVLCEWYNSARLDDLGKVASILSLVQDISNQEQSFMERTVAMVSETERQRMGLELHDVLAQQLAGLAFLSKAFEVKLSAQMPGFSAQAAQLAQLASEAVLQVRNLSSGLYPAELERRGLVAALRELALGQEQLPEVVHLPAHRPVAHDRPCGVAESFPHHAGGADQRDEAFARRAGDDPFARDKEGTLPHRFRRWPGLCSGHGAIGWKRHTHHELPVGKHRRTPVDRGGKTARHRCHLHRPAQPRFHAMNTTKTKQRILVIDDHPIVRCGLVNLLAEEDDLVVAGEAASGSEALAALAKELPDMVILDITLPDSDGIDICRKIRSRYAELPILVMSIHSEVLYADRVLRAGANGYIMKHEAPNKIVSAIRQILSGNVHVSSHAVQRMLAKVRRGGGEAPDLGVGSLTDRELEVFTLIGQGRGTKEIASELSLGAKTVETHRLSIKRKLNVRHLPDLVKRAVDWTHAVEKAG